MKKVQIDPATQRRPTSRKQNRSARIKEQLTQQVEVQVIPAKADMEGYERPKPRVCAYCRVSTDMDTQALSYELQVQNYTEYITSNIALIRNIDLNFVDDMGRTNLQRMQQGLAALDPTGQAYELHHIGQHANSTLAILTKAEHMQGGNNKIWHVLGEATEVHGAGNTWDLQRQQFWKQLAKMMTGGV